MFKTFCDMCGAEAQRPYQAVRVVLDWGTETESYVDQFDLCPTDKQRMLEFFSLPRSTAYRSRDGVLRSRGGGDSDGADSGA